MTKKRKIIIYSIVIALCAVLLVLGSFFDTEVSEKMYQPGNIAARVLECVGNFPPFVFVSALFCSLFYLVRKEDKNSILKKSLLAIGVAVPYLGFGFMAGRYAFEETLWLQFLLMALGGATLTPLTFYLLHNRSRMLLKRLTIFLLFASIVSLLSTVLSVNVLKYLWGRPRYREMIAAEDEALAAFTPWYHPNGFTLRGHHSFPSGHTSAAANLLAFCALPEVFSEADRSQKTVVFFCVVYIFSMAYSRIVLGAHFLSDVTVGFLIGFVTYAVVRYLYFDKSRRVMKALMTLNQTRDPRDEEDPPAPDETEQEKEPSHPRRI